MKRLLMVLVAGLLIAAITAPALAWEFALTGEGEWRYRYFARQGNADLFGGPAFYFGGGIAAAGGQAPALGLAGPVANVVRVQGFSAKGADVAMNDQRFWFYPEIRINPAVRMRGEYWVTGTNLASVYDGNGLNGTANPADNWVTNQGYNGWFFNGQGGGAVPSGMSVGLWEKFWVTAQTPWGILAFGRRPFAFGLGWSGLHEKDADTDSIVIVAPYGPLTFIIGPSSIAIPIDTSSVNSTPIVGVTAANAQVVNALGGAYGTDKNRERQLHFASAVTYRAGAIDTGIFYTMFKLNQAHFAANPAGPAGRDDNIGGGFGARFHATPALNGLPMYSDIGWVLFVNYFKYTNGRFFLNAEYDFQYADIRRNGGRPISWWADAWELEVGTLCGPAKFSLAAFYKSGDDRRGGQLNFTNNIGTTAIGPVYDRVTSFANLFGTQEALKPYVWLLGIYGGGNNSYDARGYPTYGDWLSYSTRLDYAVAANLNVWGSYIYAMRASNTGTAIAANAGGLAIAGRTQPAGVQLANVPDNYLGWEANVGVDWKLLEGLTFKSQFGYWQPGDWFKWANIDYGSVGTTLIGGVAYPVNPNRGIDPLIGFQGSLLVEF